MEQSSAPATAPLRDHAVIPTRKRILVKWSLIATLLVFGYFAWQCGSGMHAAAGLSDNAVRRFHSQLDAAGYEDIVANRIRHFRTPTAMKNCSSSWPECIPSWASLLT